MFSQTRGEYQVRRAEIAQDQAMVLECSEVIERILRDSVMQTCSVGVAVVA